MQCRFGDEMWGVSGQGSLENEWGARGRRGQVQYLFFLFRFDFQMFFVLPQVHTDETETAIYCTRSVYSADKSRHKSCDSLKECKMVTYKNFSHSWVSLTGKIISDRNWHKLPIWDFTQFGCLDCWLTKHILDTELSGVFATVWEICPHSDSGCKMCPFSNKTERFAGVHLGTQ